PAPGGTARSGTRTIAHHGTASALGPDRSGLPLRRLARRCLAARVAVERNARRWRERAGARARADHRPAVGRDHVDRGARSRADGVHRRHPPLQGRRRRTAMRQAARGFTLIEVLVALGIVAIALMAGLQATA